jgi:5-methylcytosine-specific restriction endonuclease McrA
MICQLCREPIKNLGEADMDHKIPKSKGGRSSLKNLQITHMACNRKRGNMTLEEWFRLKK